MMKVKLLSAKAVITTGSGKARLDILSLSVERLAELHDVEPALTQRGPDGRARIGFARRHLQLDKADYFLRHDGSYMVSANALSIALLALLVPA